MVDSIIKMCKSLKSKHQMAVVFSYYWCIEFLAWLAVCLLQIKYRKFPLHFSVIKNILIESDCHTLQCCLWWTVGCPVVN
jgi:hypothetical protein